MEKSERLRVEEGLPLKYNQPCEMQSKGRQKFFEIGATVPEFKTRLLV